jgi:hypothetical protein
MGLAADTQIKKDGGGNDGNLGNPHVESDAFLLEITDNA